MAKPLALLTNDDGIFAPGLQHLAAILQDVIEPYIVAPAQDQSSTSLSITTQRSLEVASIRKNTWAVHGTPADSVKLALSAILPAPPTIVLSGINKGTNAGRNVLYSGTAAAAIEATLHNIPAIAFSIQGSSFDETSLAIQKIIQHVRVHPMPSMTFLNVNFPDVSPFLGIRFARQGKGFVTQNPRMEGEQYWLGGKHKEFQEDEESDIALLKQGYITCVPIHIGELTDLAHFERQKHQII